MEDQKKTDVIKNMRTVLPSLSLKNGETGEQGPSPAPSVGLPPSGVPPAKKLRTGAVNAPPQPSPAPQGKPVYGHRGPDRPIQGAPSRYRMHTSTTYTPYSLGGKGRMGFPPGRQPPHTQTRYYPISRQYQYMGEMHPPQEHPHHRPAMKKLYPVHPSQHHAPPSILVPEVGEPAKIQIKDAMRYLDIVRSEYQNNTEVYNRFLKTMKDYKEKQIDARGVIEIILMLFSGNQKLLQGFNQFLPKKYEILSTGEVKIHEEGSREKREREHPPNGGRHPHERESYARSEGPSGMRYRHHREKEHEYEHRPPRPDPRSDLECLGIGIKQSRSEGEDTGRVVAYLNKVRKHLESRPSAWFEFLRIVQSYKRRKDPLQQKPISEIISSIKRLLKDDPSLIDEFMVFLPTPGIHETSRIRALHRPPTADSMGMLNDIKGILQKKGMYKEFVKALNMFNQGLLSTSSLLLVIEPFLRSAPTLYSLFRYYIGHRETEAPPHVQTNLETYTKVGSYRILPEKYRQSMHSGQSAEDASVLNTDLVSCPTFSSESSTFIFAKKNIHEEALFRVEDERYEADLLIERIFSLILKLTEYEQNAVEIANLPKERTGQAPPKLHLSEIDKETLSVVYGTSTDDIILGLVAHPIRAISVVLKQLRGVEAQWTRVRAVSVDIWRATIDKNYIKSLDVLGYKIRNGERKTSLLKQFMKDLEAASQVEFSFSDKHVCRQVVSLLQGSIEPEDSDPMSACLETLYKEATTESVFIATQEIYCALRGIASLSHKIAETIKGKRIKPKPNVVAHSLGCQEPSKTLAEEEIYALISKYVLGNIDTSKFEERALDSLGVSGTALIGIAGSFQNVEAMIQTIEEHKLSAEVMERAAHKEEVQKTSLSELLIRGTPLVRISVQEIDGTLVATAEKILPPQCTSQKWAEYVKQYTAEESNRRSPFLQRSLVPKTQKRHVISAYGLESFFTEYKYAIKHIPGTEDFIQKRPASP